MSKTFQPDSLHPYIMDARLKKATGSGGISSIPIASADTVGGIMIGDGVSIDANGAISGIAYSTTEHKTGRKWTDGKDIYEKTVDLGTLPNTTSKEVNHGITYDKVISFSALAQNSEKTVICLPMFASISNYITLSIKASTVDINTTTDRSSFSGLITIQYTKPTEP